MIHPLMVQELSCDQLIQSLRLKVAGDILCVYVFSCLRLSSHVYGYTFMCVYYMLKVDVLLEDLLLY